MNTSVLDLASVLRMTPGERRRVRESARLSRTDLARALDCSEFAVRSWETGTRSPRGALGERYGRLLRHLGAEVGL